MKGGAFASVGGASRKLARGGWAGHGECLRWLGPGGVVAFKKIGQASQGVLSHLGFDGNPVAIKNSVMSARVLSVAYRQPVCANGFLDCATTGGASDATNADAYISVENLTHALRHFAHGCFANRAMRVERFRSDIQDIA